MRECYHLFLQLLGGAVAQLGARLDGIEEVVGSNPIGSTKVFSHVFLFIHPSEPNQFPVLRWSNARFREAPCLSQRELFEGFKESRTLATDLS
jgi:hypothetical protein